MKPTNRSTIYGALGILILFLTCLGIYVSLPVQYGPVQSARIAGIQEVIKQSRALDHKLEAVLQEVQSALREVEAAIKVREDRRRIEALLKVAKKEEEPIKGYNDSYEVHDTGRQIKMKVQLY